ncbi:butyrophilin subfamily 1 member A1-like [Xyrauchen texanus]|uniref:butyrophilin subfamily 1 member A1-like n=1 Tax=Xyrauchen texanus TaxID=154827 RepID=UPI0022427844|nr:butyrophilin subfamily 1 member A1-like [Xyrauchen texanus]
MISVIIGGFLLILLIDASVSLSVVVPEDEIAGQVGSTVTLPCWISPPQNAEALEIRWYRPKHFNTPVLFYRDGKIQDVQEEHYRNRSSLGLRSAQSGGLKDGDVSLQLDKLTVQDDGVFHCYVSGDKTYDSQTVSLNVTALGSTPDLIPKPVSEDKVNMSCRSSGWFPEPNLRWMSEDRKLLSPGRVSVSREADGMFSVQSWMIISPSETRLISCLLALKTGQHREAPIYLHPSIPSEVTSGPWKALFITFLICALLGLAAFIIYKYRQKLTVKKSTEQPCEDGAMGNMREDNDVLNINMEDLRTDAVNITLDRETAHPDLMITKDLKSVRDTTGYVQKNEGFPYELCVCGANKFSSGRHYWEVELARINVPPKDYWLIGVQKDGNFRSADKSRLTPSGGFWFLCSDGKNGFHTNTDPQITLSLSSRPEQLGVLLDYDNGQLSFYNVKHFQHLLTINTKFSGVLVPLFNPGVGDTSSLTILDVSVASPDTSQQLLGNTSSLKTQDDSVASPDSSQPLLGSC